MPEKKSIKINVKDKPCAGWLGSVECGLFLEGCGGKIKARAMNQGLKLSEGSLEAGALWEFLASRLDVAENTFQALNSGNPTQARQLLANYYILHLIDLRRTRQDSAFHSLYRRARTVLSDHQDFTCISDRKGTCYAYGKNRNQGPVIKDMSSQVVNYRLLPDPVADPECSQSEYIISGAALFYTWACEHFSQTGLIPIRELTAYLMTRPKFNRDILKIIKISELEGDSDMDGQFREGMDSFPSGNTSCPQLSGMVEPALEDIARSMVDGWTEGMVQAFYLHTGREMDLVRIAGIMGYKGASGVKYQLGLVHESIRRSSAAWPLLSPPDLDEKIFNRFVEHVIIFCKQKTTSRNMDQQMEKLTSAPR